MSALPLVLVPGLLCSARLFAPQIAALWPRGPVMVANHRQGGDDIAAIAAAILENAPPHFALCGLSMGGHLAFAMMRQAPERIAKLALLDTSARPDTPEQRPAREKLIGLAEAGQLDQVVAALTPKLLHADHVNDTALNETIRIMAEECGLDAFVRQTKAIMGRPDSRPMLNEIGCPTLVLVGDGDTLTPPDRSQEIVADILGSTLVVVPNCGHLSTLEQPDAVNAALSAWLAD